MRQERAEYCEEAVVDVTNAGHLDERVTNMHSNVTGLVFDDYELFL